MSGDSGSDQGSGSDQCSGCWSVTRPSQIPDSSSCSVLTDSERIGSSVLILLGSPLSSVRSSDHAVELGSSSSALMGSERAASLVLPLVGSPLVLSWSSDQWGDPGSVSELPPDSYLASPG